MTRQRMSTDERRTQLLELGLELFGERAYDSISIEEIADLAGISKGLLYHYFGGKKAFYKATLQVAAERMLQALEPNEQGSPVDRARRGVVAYLDFVESRRTAFLAMMHGGAGNDADVHTIIEGVRAAICKQMLDTMGVHEGRAVVRIAVRSWVGAVEAASLDMLEHNDVDREVFLRLMLTSLFATLWQAAKLDPEAGIEISPDAVALLMG